MTDYFQNPQPITGEIEKRFSLLGKVAIITGASMGIGKTIATVLASFGANIVIAYRTHEQEALEARKRICELNRKAIAVYADMTCEKEMDSLIERAKSEFGRIDILVNNAGIYPHASITDISSTAWDEVMCCNLKAPFLLTKKVAIEMIRQGEGGRIINITSIDAIAPEAGLAAYDASKGGLLMFTRTSALELAKYRITVNAIGPGLIDSPELIQYAPARRKSFLNRVPLNQIGTAEDVANAVCFLASPSAGFITGQTIYVDGGILLTGYMTGVNEL